jgi:2,3-bisphosphoglycerate-independent phosphoglycerate mutase
MMDAAIKACEAVDQCLKVITTALAHNYTTILIADHGNCETMINPDGSPNTAHTTRSCTIYFSYYDQIQIHDGVLGIAPTILINE